MHVFAPLHVPMTAPVPVRLVAGAFLCSLLVASGAAATEFGHVRAEPPNAISLVGADSFEEAGVSVGRAGDVNGDGRPDLVVGADGADPHDRAQAGSAYVVFGGDVEPGILGQGPGFRIDGPAELDFLGWDVAGAGDVNDDGLDDVIVGAPKTDVHGGETGSAFVVFGKTTTTAVDTLSLGAGGFRIDGAQPGDLAGSSVGPAGDVNGDGFDDVLVGAPNASPQNRQGAGAVYLVYGKATSTTVDLTAFGSSLPGLVAGYRIDGAQANSETGGALDGGRDVNRDGVPDAVIGAYAADPRGRTFAGATYVVFGRRGEDAPSDGVLDLRALEGIGYRIDGGHERGASGYSVALLGDVNGDDRPDLATGAPGITFVVPGRSHPAGSASAEPGTAYVVFGKKGAGSIDLGAMGDRGYRIRGVYDLGRLGHSLARAGDVNRDGKPDLLVGTTTERGISYLVFGKRGTSPVRLADRIGPAFELRGDGELGWSVAGPGDLNGDGRNDLVLGSPGGGHVEQAEGEVRIVTAVTKRVRSRRPFRWSPKETRGLPGDRVVWINNADEPRRLVSYKGDWEIDVVLDAGDRTGFRFVAPGKYRFRDARHSEMENGVCTGACGVVEIRPVPEV